jgi:glutamate synthase (NADPH) small chain
MDERELREWEKRCIQEEPPACTAACPLHVDARAFVISVAEGRFTDAWQVPRKTMPFPGIPGSICDAPCQGSCTRREAGGAVRIGEIERLCVQTPPPPRHIRPFLSKKKKVVITGSGLSSLTAALIPFLNHICNNILISQEVSIWRERHEARRY